MLKETEYYRVYFEYKDGIQNYRVYTWEDTTELINKTFTKYGSDHIVNYTVTKCTELVVVRKEGL